MQQSETESSQMRRFQFDSSSDDITLSLPCMISTAPQLTLEWHNVRKTLKATGSKFGLIHKYINGEIPLHYLNDPITPNKAMQMGTYCEPAVREWFTQSQWWKPHWVMHEIGIAIPHWNNEIGSSVDGLIVDEETGKAIAIIEIKCPRYVYQSLLQPRQQRGPDCPHIQLSHYAQMQGGMAILEIDRCFYIVFGHEREVNPRTNTPKPHKVYVEEVPRNKEYWERVLYPSIQKFIE